MFNILIAQGKVPPKSSGYIRSLAVKARQLSSDGEAAVVCTETETAWVFHLFDSLYSLVFLTFWFRKILITDQNDDITVAIFKNK